MSDTTFDYPPNPSVLKQLVEPALLIDNIFTVSKAVRLYVILQFLYANNPSFIEHEFTYQDWRNFLFKDASNAHFQRDRRPNHQDRSCLCGKNLKELLFPSAIAQSEWKKWKTEFIELYATCKTREELEKYIHQLETEKPFYVTVKKIIQDLDELVTRGWLKEIEGRIYQKKSPIPLLQKKLTLSFNTSLEITNQLEDKYPFMSCDFASFANLFSQPINNIQRFFSF